MGQELPKVFEERMKDMLGDEFAAYLASYENVRQYGLRINPLKISGKELEETGYFHLQQIPWVRDGFFYQEEDQPARHPFYAAGLYYLQEPSAMTPASRLKIEPGERVLDLCAAPGGKATALGAALQGKGVLVANDISNARAKALLKNLEIFGIANAFVTNDIPGKLAENFEGFFDKVLVDAPCSGEGMFRKDPAVMKTWNPERPEYFAKLQRDILKNAVRMLRPGGLLLYSTCTFAPVENEGSVSWLLENYPEMELLEIEPYEGFSRGNPVWGNGDIRLEKCVRIWPHKMKGEGHFLALMKKQGQPDMVQQPSSVRPDANTRKWLELFLEEIGLQTLGGKAFDWNRVETRGDKVYYLPPVNTGFRGLTFLRNGLYLGDLKKNRFEPSQPFALALHKNDVKAVISLPVADSRLTRYLKGETLLIEEGEARGKKGWHLLCAEGYPLGFGKLVNGTLKNKYPAGWRV